MQRIICLAIAAFFIFVSCSSSSDGTDNGQSTENSETLWAPAWSILGTRCGEVNACHNQKSDGEGNLNLPADDEATAKSNAEARSGDIRDEIESGDMPEDSTLTQEERQMVLDWIDSL